LKDSFLTFVHLLRNIGGIGKATLIANPVGKKNIIGRVFGTSWGVIEQMREMLDFLRISIQSWKMCLYDPIIFSSKKYSKDIKKVQNFNCFQSLLTLF
jgi:hypothetical protein